MSSYVVTGASRGIGYEFIRQLSKDPANTVIGLVRNKKATDEKVAAEISRTNLHILEGDLSDYDSLKKAAEATSEITGGRLDYLIANGALISQWSSYNPIGVLGNDPSLLEQDLLDSYRANVIGNINLFNLFMPLILAGRVKKVVAISSGMADIELIARYDIDQAAPYSINKAALNAAVAKFSSQYAKDGVLFLSVCPGMVDTQQHENMTEEHKAKIMEMVGKFKAYAPHFAGPATTESSVKDVLAVVNNASVDRGYGGEFISHYGNKRWL